MGTALVARERELQSRGGECNSDDDEEEEGGVDVRDEEQVHN